MYIGRIGMAVRRERRKATGTAMTQRNALSKMKVMIVLPPLRSVK